MNKYEIIIYWSAADEVFVAEMPELKGCIAHGDTQDEALSEINAVAEEWLKMAKEKGWLIPEPKGKLMFA
ncbi:MAG: type II toxin-antitoxin system HicB family antitoxin [Segetibacter sp.]|jgi:predicted RNase H-like HicB family nuclease|nr:type II toxin-antitoxin system HicB family antitoxin [Segetibacter sp.]